MFLESHINGTEIMILVKHYLDKSSIEGVGLFTAEDVFEGQRIYQFDYRFVMIISEGEIRAMPESAREAILKYSYRGKGSERLSGAYYYCADDGRYFNHSDDPNTRWVEGDDVYVATRAISAGTEITCDYREFSDPEDWQAEFV